MKWMGGYAVRLVNRGGKRVYEVVETATRKVIQRIAAKGASAAIAKGEQYYLKLFKPLNEFDVVKKIFRGTTGSEVGSSTLF